MPAIVKPMTHATDLVRCGWGEADPLNLAYHDAEWGVPITDDRALFELLCLEGAQAGLAWMTILRKREGYRRAFEGFDPKRLAACGDAEVEPPARRPGHRAQPGQGALGASANARACLRADRWLRLLCRLPVVIRRRPTDSEPMDGDRASVPAETDASRALSRDLRQRGFQLRRPHHRVRLHAVGGHGQRPPGRLLPPRARWLRWAHPSV